MNWTLERVLNRATAAMILGYVIMAGLLITLLIRTAPMDSAEQLLWAQDWRLGYGIQPPLYTWLQFILFKIFGIHLGAVVFLKEIMLGITAWFAYLSVSRMTSDHKLGALASASLLLMPQFSYESQRSLTHSLLATALAAATLYLMVRLALESKPIPSLYGWLGVVVGLGLLSKYNFVIFFFACCAAAFSLPELRRIVLNRWMAASVCVALLIFAPHAWWFVEHVHNGLADRMAVKLHPGAEDGWLSSVGKGWWILIQFTAWFFVVPLLAVYAVGFLIWRKGKIPTTPASALWLRFLARLLGWEFVVLAVLIFGFRVTGFRSRWLQPLLVVLPPYLVLLFRERITLPIRRFVLVIAAISGVVAVLVLCVRAQVAEQTGRYPTMDAPFEQLAAMVQADGFKIGTLVGNDHWVIGNLRLYFPASRLTTPVFLGPQSSGNEPLLIVWAGREMPPEFKEFVERKWPEAFQKSAPKTVQLEYQRPGAPAAEFSYVITETGAK